MKNIDTKDEINYNVYVDSSKNYTNILSQAIVTLGFICVLTFLLGSTTQSYRRFNLYGFPKGAYAINKKVLESMPGQNPVMFNQSHHRGVMSPPDTPIPTCHNWTHTSDSRARCIGIFVVGECDFSPYRFGPMRIAGGIPNQYGIGSTSHKCPGAKMVCYRGGLS